MKAQKNKDTKKHHHLSILVSRDGLSFCFKEGTKTEILKKEFENPLSPEEILEKIKSFAIEKKLASKKPDQVVVVYANNLYSLVPEAYFDENQLPNYLKFNVKILGTDFIAYDDIPGFGFKNVYIPYANINNYFFDLFGEFEYKHAATVLMENLLAANTEKETLYAYLGERHFDLVAVKDKKLILCNTFLYETAEDFLYYVLFAAQQLKWDPETFDLKFLGNISKDSKKYGLSYTYIRNCGFLEKDKNPNPDYILLNS